jgi:hypothetical protein
LWNRLKQKIENSERFVGIRGQEIIVGKYVEMEN